MTTLSFNEVFWLIINMNKVDADSVDMTCTGKFTFQKHKSKEAPHTVDVHFLVTPSKIPQLIELLK